MMSGIRLSNGVMFVTDGISTVRIRKNGEVGFSPISYFVLEHDLCFENPASWDYMSEREIMDLPDGAADRILAILKETRDRLGLSD